MSEPDEDTKTAGAGPTGPGFPLPRWLDWAFAGSAVALALLVGLSIQREVMRPALIEQRLVPALGVVDRCENCHAADTHPGDLLASHPPERFACTPCHGGQGWAVTADEAHRAQPDWERPLFTDAEREAACGRCHVGGPLAGAPRLTVGRAALDRLGCVACHTLPETPAHRGGPELDGLRDRVEPGWVRAWLRDPAALDARHRMPRFRLSDDDIEALVAYLFTLPGPTLSPLPEGGDADRGKVAVARRRCATCHLIEGRGGDTAASLDHLGAKLRPEWVFTLLTGTHRVRPTTSMPDFRLPADEAADIVAYAGEQLVPDTAEPAWAPHNRPVLAERAADGERLFARLGCGGCHGIAGRTFEKVGVPLLDLGARRVSELPPPKDGAPASDVPGFVALKLRAPQTFDVEGAAPAIMPTFRLNASPPNADDEALAIGVALAALARPVTHPDYRRTTARPVFEPPPGEIAHLFERFRCLVCHRIDGTGGDVSGIPLDGAGARLARPWLVEFLRAPVTVRMDQPERMPVLGMTPAEAEDLAAWIGLALGDARVPAEPAAETVGGATAIPAAEPAAGERVYTERACSKCHMIGGQGEMKGPTLDAVASRLRRSYARAMLLDPALVPLGRHGDLRLDAPDADAVVSWLWSRPPPAATP